MVKKNVKVENTTKSRVTINLKGFNDKCYAVKAKGSVAIDEDELNYIMNTSQVFKMGTLRVVNKEELVDSVDVTELESPNALSDAGIDLFLKKTQKSLMTELEKIDSIQVIQKILDRANELDKTVRVIEMIETRLEQLLELA